MLRNKKIFETSLITFSIIWLVLVILHLIFAGRIPLWIYFQSIPPFFFIIVPLLFLAWETFWKNRKWVRILPALLALVLGATQVDINLAQKRNIPLQAGAYMKVHLFVWNTNIWDQHKNRRMFIQFIKKHHADIYMFQEYLHGVEPDVKLSPKIIKQLNLFKICSTVSGFPYQFQPFNDIGKLKQEFPGYYMAINQQFLILSRFPIIASHLNYSDQYAVTDININSRIVRFFNVHILLHLESPLMQDFYAAIKRRFEARQLAFKNLEADIQKTSTDYLISGDFNSTTAMGTMNHLLRNNIDAVNYSNELLPLTFEFSGLKLWRFDYTLVSKTNQNIFIKSYQNLNPEGFSDHTPQFLVLNICNGNY